MIEDYFVNTVALRRAGAVDRYGQASKGATLEFKCRLRFKQRRHRTDDGSQLVSSAEIHFSSTVTIATGDWIDHDGKSWEVVAVSGHQGFEDTYQIAYLGGSSNERSA